MLKVLIADDHPVFRYGIRALLEATRAVEVVGEATNGAEAIALAESLQPDVILMDVQMPALNGLDATRQIVKARPQVRVLVVTMFEDDGSVFAAMRAGAAGYILKDAAKDEILRALQTVAGGGAIFSPTIAARLLAFFATPRLRVPDEAFPALTDREREILAWIAQGMSNPEIAQRMVLSAKTVSNYVSAILGKLQVADRAEAMIRAREAGLGDGARLTLPVQRTARD